MDARVGYRFGMRSYRIDVFGTINNLFDKGPQAYLAAAFTATFNSGTGHGVDPNSDMRGRRYVFGVAVSFRGVERARRRAIAQVRPSRRLAGLPCGCAASSLG